MHSHADSSTLDSSTFFKSACSLTQCVSHFTPTSFMNINLNRMSRWVNRISLNWMPTWSSFCPSPCWKFLNFPIYFNGSVILSLDSMNILSIDITSTLFEEHNIIGIAESASKKLGVLFQSQNFFYSEQLFHLYKNYLSLWGVLFSHLEWF